jgi:hypothetical protein
MILANYESVKLGLNVGTQGKSLLITGFVDGEIAHDETTTLNESTEACNPLNQTG